MKSFVDRLFRYGEMFGRTRTRKSHIGQRRFILERLEDRLTPSGDSFSAPIGTIAAGGSATLLFEATVDEPLTKGIDRVYNQASISGTGLATFRSDDPAVPGQADATVTPVDRAPSVTAVFVSSSNWTSSYLSSLASQGLGSSVYGYAVPTGAAQLNPLTWNKLDRVSIRFSENVSVAFDDLSVFGVKTANYSLAPAAFSYNSANFTATWGFASPIGTDKLRFVLDGGSTGVRAVADGKQLDGEWIDGTATFNSGNGVAGANFSFRVDVGNVRRATKADPTGFPSGNPGGSAVGGWVAPTAPVPPSPPGGVAGAVSATLVAQLVTDVDGDGQVDAGDRVRYTLTIVNSGAAAVSGVWVDDTLDARMTLVAGSITPSAPLAATFSNGGPVVEGSSGSVAFANVTGGLGGYSYSYDFNNDGTFEAVNSAQATAQVPATYLPDGPATRVVRGRVRDSGGNFFDITTTITVNNAPPTVTLPGSYSGQPGAAVSFSATVTDPSPADTAAGFTYSWNFGDGATSTQSAPGHAYAASGSYTVSVTVRDKDGGSRTASTTATVTSVTNSFPNNLTPPLLPAPTGPVIRAATLSQLQSAVANLRSGDTILIDPGTYTLTGPLYLPQNISNVAIRGATGNRDDVVIRGNGMAGTVRFGIWAANVTNLTIANLTLRDVSDHTIILNGGVEAPRIYNVRLVDSGDQQLKANPDGAGGGVDNGVVEYCVIEYTTVAPDSYTQGVDVHTGAGWVIRNNVFRNFRTADGQIGPVAILMWNGSRDTVTEGNTFIDNHRDILYGLDSPGAHSGGVIRNNFIWRRSGLGSMDVAIGLSNSPNTQVLHNTIKLNGTYPNAVEYRFASTTGVQIKNNLTDAALVSRDGATATVSGNVTTAQSSWFVNAATGDLHLVSAATAAIDKGSAVGVTRDYDGQARPSGAAPDVGADEFAAAADTTPPTVTGVTPANGATGVSTAANVTVTFSEAVDAATVTGTTVLLRDAANNLVAAAVTYNAATRTATLNPTPTLANSATYTVVVVGGAQGVKDLAGNALAADSTSTFTTAAAMAAPVANAGADKTANEGSSVAFSGLVTGGEPALTYAWAFGDGGSASGTLTPSHTFADNGSYTVTLTVTDALGRTSNDTLAVTVANVAPTPNPGGPYSGTPGSAVAFAGGATDPSSADTAAGFTYRWDFGDATSSTLRNPSHAYAAAGNYTASLTATDKDGASASRTVAVTVAASTPRNTDALIVTPYDQVPNFGRSPTIWTTGSGNWSNAGTWSAGRLPAAGDVVSVDSGHTLTYDVVSDAALDTVIVQSGGRLVFRTDVNTRLTVVNLLVLQNGELQVGTAANPVAAGVKAEVVIANVAINTAADPAQWGHGLIAFGKVTMHGAAKPDGFIRLAAEPRLGQTTLTLGAAAVGWQVGDRLVLPDTRHLRDLERGANYVSQVEQLTIAAISADGRTLTLSAPLRYDHPGARDSNGTLEFLPHVANTTRNVSVRSQSATGTRGHVVFLYRADVDVRYVGFGGLGRTREGAVGSSNPEDRNPVQFRHLFGTAAGQANGYQYTFAGNAITCPLDPMPFVWGINVNDSHYGLIQGNVLFNWAGAAFVTKTGKESYNVIERNFVAKTNGSSERVDETGMSGSAFWMRGPNNYIRDNVATSVNGSGTDAYSYGYYIIPTFLGSVTVPKYRGADPSVAAQSALVDMNAIPLPEFARNEAYGATLCGLSVWWIGAYFETVKGSAGVIKDFRVWHQSVFGFFGYETNNLLIDGFVARGDQNVITNGFETARGMWFSDYMTRGLVIRNANIQGMSEGILAPIHVGRGLPGDTTLIEGGFLANRTNIVVSPPRSVNGSSGLSAKTLVVRNVRFGTPRTLSASAVTDIEMNRVVSDALGTSNFSIPDLVYVYDYNGVVGDDFQVFYTQVSGSNSRSRIGGYVIPV